MVLPSVGWKKHFVEISTKHPAWIMRENKHRMNLLSCSSQIQTDLLKLAQPVEKDGHIIAVGIK
jgi:hypothetical protein